MNPNTVIWPTDPVFEYCGGYVIEKLFAAIAQAALSDCILVLFNSEFPELIISLATASDTAKNLGSQLPAPIVGGCPSVVIEATPAKLRQLIIATENFCEPEYVTSLFVLSYQGNIWLDASDIPSDPFYVAQNAPVNLINSLNKTMDAPTLTTYDVYGL